jgi:hypothetical protein
MYLNLHNIASLYKTKSKKLVAEKGVNLFKLYCMYVVWNYRDEIYS